MAGEASTKEFQWDVFVSHNRCQKDWARATVSQWRRLGLRVFFDEDCIEPGEDIAGGVERGLKNSLHTVLIISPESVQSRWVAMESSITVYTDPNASERRLIPVLLKRTEMTSVALYIQRLNWIDLTDKDLYQRIHNYHYLLSYLGIKEKSAFIDNAGRTGARTGSGD